MKGSHNKLTKVLNGRRFAQIKNKITRYLTFAVPCRFLPARPVRPSGWTFVCLNFYVFRIRKFREKANIRLIY
jgi:hypothetical protein